MEGRAERNGRVGGLLLSEAEAGVNSSLWGSVMPYLAADSVRAPSYNDMF